MVENKVFRVFLVKSFRECVHFDVEAVSAKAAKARAGRAARSLLDDKKVREVATDNGWIAEDEPIVVEYAGYPSPKVYGTKEVWKGVYVDGDFGVVRFADGRELDCRKDK